MGFDDISTTIDDSDYTDQIIELDEFKTSLEETFSAENQEYVDDILAVAETIINHLKYGLLPTMVATVILVFGAIFSWIGCDSKLKSYFCFQKWFIMPLFVFIEVIAAVITSAFGIILLALADLCTGGEDQSPEGSVKQILDSLQYEEDVQKSVDYYIIDGCRTENPFTGLIESQMALKNITIYIDEAVTTLEPFLGDVCTDSTELYGLVSELNNDLNDLNSEIEKGIDVTECKNINSIYIDAMHNSTCTSTATAIAWMFWCVFATWLAGLLMLATRSACRPSNRTCNKDDKSELESLSQKVNENETDGASSNKILEEDTNTSSEKAI